MMKKMTKKPDMLINVRNITKVGIRSFSLKFTDDNAYTADGS